MHTFFTSLSKMHIGVLHLRSKKLCQLFYFYQHLASNGAIFLNGYVGTR